MDEAASAPSIQTVMDMAAPAIVFFRWITMTDSFGPGIT
jgi:hypothetical protein